jgi:hypothetical protein
VTGPVSASLKVRQTHLSCGDDPNQSATSPLRALLFTPHLQNSRPETPESKMSEKRARSSACRNCRPDPGSESGNADASRLLPMSRTRRNGQDRQFLSAGDPPPPATSGRAAAADLPTNDPSVLIPPPSWWSSTFN